jgi:hypothetical protein
MLTIIAAPKRRGPMKPNELKEKVHELEEALNERMGEVARTKTSEAENQEMSAIQQRIKNLLEEVNKLNGEEGNSELVRQADELLLELRQPLA